MRARFGWIGVILPLFISASCGGGLPKIEGTFIQYQNWMMKLPKEQWVKELDAINKASLDTIIIQWLKLDQNTFLEGPHKQDPTEYILDYGAKHKLAVWVGIAGESDWWRKWNDPVYLKESEARTVKFAKTIWHRYRSYPSFKGWYLPFELSDKKFSNSEVEALNSFLKGTVSGLKGISGKKFPVAMSVFFWNRTTPAQLEHFYGRILKNTHVDVGMVQDGVGVHDWGASLEQDVVPSLRAYANSMRKNGIKPWVIVESFAKVDPAASAGKSRTTADFSRIMSQIHNESQYGEKTVTFDFFHYISPFRGAPQGKLYKEYLKNFLFIE